MANTNKVIRPWVRRNRLPIDSDIIGETRAVYGQGWDLLLGAAVADFPPDKDFSEFEGDISNWTRKHHQIQSHTFGTLQGGLRYLSEMLRQDVGSVSEAWASNERLSYRKIFDDQLEWRRMHYNFYPCVRADSLTRIVVRHDGFRRPSEQTYLRGFDYQNPNIKNIPKGSKD